MQEKLRSGLTYANVMATVAVFLALGGTSYAVATGSIDSRELKNNTVRSRDIRNNDVRSRDVRNGSLLAGDFKAGELPAGPRGPQGAGGAQGAQGPPGISGLQKVIGQSANNSNSGKSATATCPAGKRAIGSGGQVGGLSGAFPNELANVVITFIEPSDENAVPGSVGVFAFEQVATASNWFVQASALCANVR